MEQRNQMLRELQLNKKQSLGVVSVKNQTGGGARELLTILSTDMMLYIIMQCSNIW